MEHFCENFALVGYSIGIYPDKTYICNENDEIWIKVYKAIQDDQKCEEIIVFLKLWDIRYVTLWYILKKETRYSHIYSHIWIIDCVMECTL